MTTFRKDIIATDEIYHVFNRSVERRAIFTNVREYKRILEIIRYYHFASLTMKYSQYHSLPHEIQHDILSRLIQNGEKEVAIYAFAIMPNHLHFCVKQIKENGISIFLSNLANSYAKYFNIRQNRTGSLWQHPFKALRIENEEQLLHVVRYIHLNPVIGYVIKEDVLDTYQYTSLAEYLQNQHSGIADTEYILSYFKSREAFRSFTHEHIGYAKKLLKKIQVHPKGAKLHYPSQAEDPLVCHGIDFRRGLLLRSIGKSSIYSELEYPGVTQSLAGVSFP